MKSKTNPNKIIELAKKIYEGLSEQEIDEMEKIMLDRSNFFGKNPNRILELLEGITEDNLHGEIDWGKPVGKEIID